jgi:hypothetical protein
MLEEGYRRLTEKLNGTFSVEDEDNMAMGISHPSSTYRFLIPHNDVIISAEVQIGHADRGFLRCEIEPQKSRSQFVITRPSLYRNFFWKKKKKTRGQNEFQVACSNSSLIVHLRKNVDFYKLFKIADNTMFDPVIEGKNIGNKFVIDTVYPLMFAEKVQVLSLLIELYKTLIDYFEAQR